MLNGITPKIFQCKSQLVRSRGKKNCTKYTLCSALQMYFAKCAKSNIAQKSTSSIHCIVVQKELQKISAANYPSLHLSTQYALVQSEVRQIKYCKEIDCIVTQKALQGIAVKYPILHLSASLEQSAPNQILWVFMHCLSYLHAPHCTWLNSAIKQQKKDRMCTAEDFS